MFSTLMGKMSSIMNSWWAGSMSIFKVIMFSPLISKIRGIVNGWWAGSKIERYCNTISRSRILSKKSILGIVGILLCIIAVCFGLYMGLFVCFGGGIADIVTGITASPVSSYLIAWGFIKVVCSAFVGWGSLAIVYACGLSFIQASDRMKY